MVLEVTARLQDVLFDGLPFFNKKPLIIVKESTYLPITLIPNLRSPTYSHNSLGFRGKEFLTRKNEDVYRIVCLGGSAVYGTCLSEQETLPAQLEVVLNDAYRDLKFEVINAGVPSYTTMDSLINLATRILPLEPDMIIIYHGYNDFAPNRYPDFKSDYTHFRIRKKAKSLEILDILSSKSSFIRNMINLYYKIARFLNKHKAFDIKVRGTRTHNSCVQEGIDVFKRNLKSMVYLARAHDIVPIISTYAMAINEENLKNHPERFKNLKTHCPSLTDKGVLDAKKRYNQAIREIAKTEDVIFIDNGKLMPETFEYQYDYCHFTAFGARKTAENFAKVILNHLEKRADIAF